LKRSRYFTIENRDALAISAALNACDQSTPVMELPKLSIATAEMWDRAYETAVERNFFQSPHWGQVVSEAFGFFPATMAFEFSFGRVVLPCFIHRRLRGCFRGLLSMPPYHYGGLLSAQALTADMTKAIAKRLRFEWLVHTLIVSSTPGNEIVGWEEYQQNIAWSQVLDLRGGFEAVWKHRFDAKQRNSVRKGNRAGLTVRKDGSPNAIAAYYDLYLMSCRRWNQQSPESHIYFESLIEQGAPMVELWLASKEGHDIAGIIIANNGQDTAYYLSNASDAHYWEYSPNNVLLALAIEEACNRGFAQFDFLPSGRIRSVEQFKESFGVTRTLIPQYWIKGRLPSLKQRFQSIRIINEC
jgi:CelD/BcsL family acetyltransferase involved in cellulose biosynthesis